MDVSRCNVDRDSLRLGGLVVGRSAAVRGLFVRWFMLVVLQMKNEEFRVHVIDLVIVWQTVI